MPKYAVREKYGYDREIQLGIVRSNKKKKENARCISGKSLVKLSNNFSTN